MNKEKQNTNFICLFPKHAEASERRSREQTATEDWMRTLQSPPALQKMSDLRIHIRADVRRMVHRETSARPSTATVAIHAVIKTKSVMTRTPGDDTGRGWGRGIGR
jgi:hypothetical protein